MRSSLPVLLALDTSTRIVGLALYDGVQVLAESTWLSDDYHTVELAPAVEALLDRCGLKSSDLDVIAVAIGPGSFTGIRIGLALAKGLALARHIPLVGVPTLDVLAAAQPPQPLPMAAALRLGRGKLAVGWYCWHGDAWQLKGKFELLTLEELMEKILEPTIVCGELGAEERLLLGKERSEALLTTPAWSLRRASFLAETGWQRWQAGRIDDPVTLAPIYLHYNDLLP
jgi:tRNA threonylcarbamoyladenosine biosynthesis protein TsaB